MNNIFEFKKFSINQTNCAMKVGTDGVLLGAWSDVMGAKNILDIGTGTGLIAMMMAQKNNTANIIGIELDELAAIQAMENCKKSIYNNQITIINTSLQLFNPTILFDVIVCNPPYFEINKRTNNDARKTARQKINLTFETLLYHTKKLLSATGKSYFIVPFLAEIDFIKMAECNGLFLQKIRHIRGNKNTDIKRSLLQFNHHFTENRVDQECLVLEHARHHYTNEYMALVKDFYLKM